MIKKINALLLLTVSCVSLTLVGCQPKTTSEKVADKTEDAAHETGQAIERAGERVKDKAD